MLGWEIGIPVAIVLIVMLGVWARRVVKRRAERAREAATQRAAIIAERRALLDKVDDGDLEAAYELFGDWVNRSGSDGFYLYPEARAELFALKDDGLYNRFYGVWQRAEELIRYDKFAQKAEELHVGWRDVAGGDREIDALSAFLCYLFTHGNDEQREDFTEDRAFDVKMLRERLVNLFYADSKERFTKIDNEASLLAYIALQRERDDLVDCDFDDEFKPTYWPDDGTWNDLVDRVMKAPTHDHYRNLPELDRSLVALLAATAVYEGSVGQAKRALAYCRVLDVRSFVGSRRTNQLYDLVVGYEPFRV